MAQAYILDIARTPVGRYGGTLSAVRPDDLVADLIKKIIERNTGLPPILIEDVILGAANQAGEDNRNVARMAGLLAGLPIESAGVTVNRLCGSGLQAIAEAARIVKSGEGEVVIAGGVESMSRAPFVLGKSTSAFDRNQQMFDTTMGWRFINPALSQLHHPFLMGETAENVAERWSISREEQDSFALQSQTKYFNALASGKWDTEEIISVAIPQKKGEPLIFAKDEHPRQTDMAQLAKLTPAFKKNGTVTAGNASGINDGAAIAIVVSEQVVKKYNLKPLVRVVTSAVAGVLPEVMGIGPVPATQKLLLRAGLNLKDIGLFELNEAFAAQSLACIKDLDLNPEIVNVNGGSIAIGHPLGASGCRISATLIHEMHRRNEVKFGVATMCIGVGQGIAMLYEKV